MKHLHFILLGGGEWWWWGGHKKIISLKAKAKVDLEQSISFKYLLMYWTSETCTHSF